MNTTNCKLRTHRQRQRPPVGKILFLSASMSGVAILFFSAAVFVHRQQMRRATDVLPQGALVGQEIISDPKRANNELRRLFPNGFEVPEYQLRAPNYPVVISPVLGHITFTGAFMEPHGHSWKSTTYAVFSDQPEDVQQLAPSDRNLGIDYVVSDFMIRSFYPGEVQKVGREGHYGYRCHIKSDLTVELNGKAYPVMTAYAHADGFSVQPGQKVGQGEVIGVMGGTGGGYSPHVDLRIWVDAQGQRIDLSPNVIEAQQNVI